MKFKIIFLIMFSNVSIAEDVLSLIDLGIPGGGEISLSETVADAAISADGILDEAGAFLDDTIAILNGTYDGSSTRGTSEQLQIRSNSCPLANLAFDTLKADFEELLETLNELEWEKDNKCREVLNSTSLVQTGASNTTYGWDEYVLPTDEQDEMTPEQIEEHKKEYTRQQLESVFNFTTDMFNEPECFKDFSVDNVVSLGAAAMKMSTIVPTGFTWALGLGGVLGEAAYGLAKNLTQYFSEPQRTERRQDKKKLSVAAACLMLDEAEKFQDVLEAFTTDIDGAREEETIMISALQCHAGLDLFEQSVNYDSLISLFDSMDDLNTAIKSDEAGALTDKCVELRGLVRRLGGDNSYFISLKSEKAKELDELTSPTVSQTEDLRALEQFDSLYQLFEEGFNDPNGSGINCDTIALQAGLGEELEDNLADILSEEGSKTYQKLLESIPGILKRALGLIVEDAEETIEELRAEDTYQDFEEKHSALTLHQELMENIILIQGESSNPELRREERIESLNDLVTLHQEYESLRDTFLNPFSPISFKKFTEVESRYVKEYFRDLKGAVRKAERINPLNPKFCEHAGDAVAAAKNVKTSAQSIKYFCKTIEASADDLELFTQRLDDQVRVMERQEREIDPEAELNIPGLDVYNVISHKVFYNKCVSDSWQQYNFAKNRAGKSWPEKKIERNRLKNYHYWLDQLVNSDGSGDVRREGVISNSAADGSSTYQVKSTTKGLPFYMKRLACAHWDRINGDPPNRAAGTICAQAHDYLYVDEDGQFVPIDEVEERGAVPIDCNDEEPIIPVTEDLYPEPEVDGYSIEEAVNVIDEGDPETELDEYPDFMDLYGDQVSSDQPEANEEDENDVGEESTEESEDGNQVEEEEEEVNNTPSPSPQTTAPQETSGIPTTAAPALDAGAIQVQLGN